MFSCPSLLPRLSLSWVQELWLPCFFFFWLSVWYRAWNVVCINKHCHMKLTLKCHLLLMCSMYQALCHILYIHTHTHTHTYIYIYFFIYGSAGSWLLFGLFSSCGEQGPLSSCRARASHCGSLSCCRAQAPGCAASVTVAHRLSSCGAQAWLFRDMWDPPSTGI